MRDPFDSALATLRQENDKVKAEVVRLKSVISEAHEIANRAILRRSPGGLFVPVSNDHTKTLVEKIAKLVELADAKK